VIAVTDDDCVPDARWVEVLARELGSDPTLDAVSGRVLPWGPETEGLHAVSSRTSVVGRDHAGKTVPWEIGTGANFCVRCEWLARLGGYDVRLGVGSPGRAGEDMDVVYRLLSAGARIRYQPDAVVYHERQPTSRRARSRYAYGHGMGACCGLWMRERDPFAAWILGRWIAMRLRRLLRSLAGRDGHPSREELDVLRGTAVGLGYGLRVGGSRERGPLGG
jgi:GT2 family glycosyltransferase